MRGRCSTLPLQITLDGNEDALHNIEGSHRSSLTVASAANAARGHRDRGCGATEWKAIAISGVGHKCLLIVSALLVFRARAKTISNPISLSCSPNCWPYYAWVGVHGYNRIVHRSCIKPIGYIDHTHPFKCSMYHCEHPSSVLINCYTRRKPTHSTRTRNVSMWLD